MNQAVNGVIYIVEEDAGWRNFALDALRHYGFGVESMATVADFVVQSLAMPPLLIILGTPVISAGEVDQIDTLQQHLPHVPLVVVSASLTRDGLRQAFLHGAADVTRKSFDPQELLALVQEQVWGKSSKDTGSQPRTVPVFDQPAG